MWNTMMRFGGVHALDVEDYDSDEKYLEVHHRPRTGAPIENNGDGERIVALSERLCNLLDDWAGGFGSLSSYALSSFCNPHISIVGSSRFRSK